MDWGTEVKSRGQHSRVGEKEGGWDRVEGAGTGRWFQGRRKQRTESTEREGKEEMEKKSPGRQAPARPLWGLSSLGEPQAGAWDEQGLNPRPHSVSAAGELARSTPSSPAGPASRESAKSWVFSNSQKGSPGAHFPSTRAVISHARPARRLGAHALPYLEV